MNVTIDPGLIAAAAAATGTDPGMTPGEQTRAMLRQLAGTRRPSTLTAEGGAAPKRAGRAWERDVVRHAQDRGFTGWDQAPLRGRRDLLDVTGCLPAGLLVGCKAIETGVTMSSKLWDSMDQCHRAMAHLPRTVDPAAITPVQVIQRRNATVGAAYAVTEWNWFLDLAAELTSLRNDAGKTS